ncbi:MAG: anthranilate synthase component I [Bacteroidetes bacterium]|nr:MAG: anthranilate synthase component I [Bacteroidota bacterium]
MTTTFSDFTELIKTGRDDANGKPLIVPVVKRLSADLLTPVTAFLLLRQDTDFAFLLESVEGGEKLARYSFIGRNPYKILQFEGDVVQILEAAPANPDSEADSVAYTSEVFDGTIIDALRQETTRFFEVPVPGLPRLRAGAVGFLGYDCVRLLENIPDNNPQDIETPDAIWGLYNTVAAFDHVKHQIVLMSSVIIEADSDLNAAYETACNRITRLEEDLRPDQVLRPEPVRLSGDVSSNINRADFESSIEAAKRYIVEGDIFQVVLSQRFQLSFEGDSFNLYRALRQVNPSPYLFYLKFPEFELIGSSPEVLVRVTDGISEVLPIAGTRPRGMTPDEDKALATELLADVKERAEHLMLVDLGRNDLGRTSKTGSVTVDKYAYIERYSHVMHIVTSVSGEVSKQHDSLDVLCACFPAGTVSGAPKVRAMEIIDELEISRRGVYSGTVGYVGYNGDLDTCITIRTMLVRGNTIYIQAGAGIVADSDPAREFDETVNKARALRRAIEVASTELI